MKRTATTLLCAFTTVGVFAGIASASTTEEQAYLQQLGKGFSAGHPRTDDQLITLGHDVCAKVTAAVAKGNYEPGKFDSDLASDKSVLIEAADTTKLREAATKNLCPDAVKDKNGTSAPAGKDSTQSPKAHSGKENPSDKKQRPDSTGIPGLDTGSSGGGNKPTK